MTSGFSAIGRPAWKQNSVPVAKIGNPALQLGKKKRAGWLLSGQQNQNPPSNPGQPALFFAAAVERPVHGEKQPMPPVVVHMHTRTNTHTTEIWAVDVLVVFRSLRPSLFRPLSLRQHRDERASRPQVLVTDHQEVTPPPSCHFLSLTHTHTRA